MKKYDTNTNPMKKCPRFEICSVPICPLDSGQDNRTYLKREPRCTLSKAIRHRIGVAAGLPRQGLTKSEWAAKERWRGISESERTRRTVNLRPFRSILHGCQETNTMWGRETPSGDGVRKYRVNFVETQK